MQCPPPPISYIAGTCAGTISSGSGSTTKDACRRCLSTCLTVEAARSGAFPGPPPR